MCTISEDKWQLGRERADAHYTSTGRCAWKNSGLMQLPVESTVQVQVQYSTTGQHKQILIVSSDDQGKIQVSIYEKPVTVLK